MASTSPTSRYTYLREEGLMERHELRDLIDHVLDDRLPDGYVLDDGGGSMSWVMSDDGATVFGIDIVTVSRSAKPEVQASTRAS
jgi:2-polyprenyl-3-methyl-5-hydroxy-6-metoxy-1,4-benzoquinol methylase